MWFLGRSVSRDDDTGELLSRSEDLPKASQILTWKEQRRVRTAKQIYTGGVGLDTKVAVQAYTYVPLTTASLGPRYNMFDLVCSTETHNPALARNTLLSIATHVYCTCALLYKMLHKLLVALYLHISGAACANSLCRVYETVEGTIRCSVRSENEP
jgi:hypothetical protein